MDAPTPQQAEFLDAIASAGHDLRQGLRAFADLIAIARVQRALIAQAAQDPATTQQATKEIS